MAEGKNRDANTGPVKPPVLEGKAREANRPDAVKPEAAKPAAAAMPDVPTAKPEPSPAKPEAQPLKDAPKKDEPPKASPPPLPPTPPAPPVIERSSGPSPIWPTLAGGVLGLAAAYGLAWAGLWPAPPQLPPSADPRLAEIAAELPELRTVAETTQSELAALHQRVGAIEASPPALADGSVPPPAPVDLSTVEADIAALSARIDTLPAPAAADPAEIAALGTQMMALGTRLDEIAARLGTAEASVDRLDTSVTATAEALDAQPSDIGAVLQLPLILSGFEAAFTSGRPYETELNALRAALPDAAVPSGIANAATTGIARADIIDTRFTQLLPAILAGRPANPDAAWQDGALDWFRSMIALRPTGAVEGDDPEAMVSRLEAAIARRDFATAEQLFTGLPAPMLAAAEEVPANVALQAEAARFLDTLRQSALGGAGEATP